MCREESGQPGEVVLGEKVDGAGPEGGRAERGIIVLGDDHGRGRRLLLLPRLLLHHLRHHSRRLVRGHHGESWRWRGVGGHQSTVRRPVEDLRALVLRRGGIHDAADAI